MNRGLRSPLLVGLTASLLFSSCTDDSVESEAPSQVELDASQLSARSQLTVHFDPPLVTGSVFYFRLSGGSLYWLSPAIGDLDAEFGVADPSGIAVAVEAIRRESAVLSLPDIPDDESAELCFDEDLAFCVPFDVSQEGDATIPRPNGGKPGLTTGFEKQRSDREQASEAVDEPEPADATLEVQERMHMGGLFGRELRENFGSQLGVIGWSDDHSEFVVRGIAFTRDQVSRIKMAAQRLGIPVRVIETALTTGEQQQLSDLIRERILHALPSEVGWTVGIDLDSQRIGVAVESYSNLSELDRAIRSVAEDFLRTLGLERAAINAPSLDKVDAGDLYYVVDTESAQSRPG